MVAAIQVCALAACIVLFVPMAMAGWHLSRNKMLFFSGALFITLAVCVHLTPYFPLLFVNNSNYSVVNFDSPLKPCITLLHNVKFSINWDDLRDDKPSSVEKIGSWGSGDSDNVVLDTIVDNLSDEKSSSVKKIGSWDRVHDDNVESNDNVDNLSDEKATNVEKIGSWSWVDDTNVIACGFQKLGRPDSSDLLNGSWVVVAGDSQARLFSIALLGLVLGEEKMKLVRGDMFKRHSNYHIDVGEIGMRMDFVWAPYVEEIIKLVVEFKKNGSYPDVFVMGVGLWDMLHVSDPSAYGFLLRKLKISVASFGSPHMFWLGMPNLVNSMLNTEEKREKMTDSARESYDKEMFESELLRGSNGPLLMIDVEILSRECGRTCTVDGMHYDSIVYEAAVHILLNALLIESHQKL